MTIEEDNKKEFENHGGCQRVLETWGGLEGTECELIEQLGQGASGIVFSVNIKEPSRTIKCAVKITQSGSKERLEQEIELTKTAGEKNIGVEIYKSKIYTFGNYKVAYIIMDVFDYSLDSRKFRDLEQDIKFKVLKEVLELIKKMIIDEKILCFDVKPGNMVYCEKNEIVRLIDFDKQYCISGNVDASYNKYILFGLFIQSFSMFFDYDKGIKFLDFINTLDDTNYLFTFDMVLNDEQGYFFNGVYFEVLSVILYTYLNFLINFLSYTKYDSRYITDKYKQFRNEYGVVLTEEDHKNQGRLFYSFFKHQLFDT